MKISLAVVAVFLSIIAFSVISVAEPKTVDKNYLGEKLTPLQYQVTQEGATEPPFDNAYWNNEAPGIYVEITSGKPVFSSLDKFDSGTGWPSFTKALEPDNIVLNERKTWYLATYYEVQSAGSHLGDLFNDGPAPTHKRYCIDSAALLFIPVDQLETKGYGQYLQDFQGA